jgi:hypothetical protein
MNIGHLVLRKAKRQNADALISVQPVCPRAELVLVQDLEREDLFARQGSGESSEQGEREVIGVA